ncbi:MAG: Gfo/Idh/MocA family oxidoreductase [Verrucomicrobiota bacterium]
MTQTRRKAIKTIVAFGALAPTAIHSGTKTISPNSRIHLACAGVGGKGWDDMIGASGDGERHNVVAICDIDHRDGGEQPSNLAKVQAARPLGIGAAKEKFPKAKVYADFRQMLEQKDIDAVTVSTPDHMHATIAITAMQLGKHVYVQKPLTQTIHESRVMRQVAREHGVVTQLGTQHHSSATYRTAFEVLRAGIIGKIREVHAWTSSPSWPQGMTKPSGSDPVPEGLHWDLWLAVSKPSAYVKHTYHNFNWRGWKEYGTGALGDMGCHIMDPTVWSLELGPPLQVSAKVRGAAKDAWPEASTVSYKFAGTKHTAGDFNFHWHDGGNSPPEEFAELSKLTSNGTLYLGEKGSIVLPNGRSIARLFPREEFLDYSQSTLKEMYQSFADEKLDHYAVWTDAILNGKQASCHFDYAGPLNETVMVGTVAQRLPERTLNWNAENLTFDDPDATALVRRQYRKGWEIDALT